MVGDKVDVDASSRRLAHLSRSGSKAAAAAITLPAGAVTCTVTGNDPPSSEGNAVHSLVTCQSWASGIHPEAATHALNCDAAGSLAVELLLPLLPAPVVREVATDLVNRLRRGSIECCEDDEIPLPDGVASWADWTGFSAPVLADFDEILAEHQARQVLEHGAGRRGS